MEPVEFLDRWNSDGGIPTPESPKLPIPAAVLSLRQPQSFCRWAMFEAQPPEAVTLDNIPWPPSAAQLLGWLTAALQAPRPSTQAHPDSRTTGATADHAGVAANAGDSATSRARRVAFRQASMRWHPDKFEARHGDRIAATEREGVMAAVQAMMQDILDAAAEDDGTK